MQFITAVCAAVALTNKSMKEERMLKFNSFSVFKRNYRQQYRTWRQQEKWIDNSHRHATSSISKLNLSYT